MTGPAFVGAGLDVCPIVQWPAHDDTCSVDITTNHAAPAAESEATMARTSPTLQAIEATVAAMTAAVGDYFAKGERAPEGLFNAYMAAEQALLAERGRLYAGSRYVADGGTMVAQWHTGPASDEAVMYEAFDASGVRTAHGFIDSASRRIVQVG